MSPFLLLFDTIQRDSVISFPALGNLSLNPPSYFTVFGRPIYFYGVLIALGCWRSSTAHDTPRTLASSRTISMT